MPTDNYNSAPASRRSRWRASVRILLLVLLAFASCNAWGGTLYTIKRADGDNFLAEIDTGTLELRIVGRLLANFGGGGLAWDPESSILYMVTASNNYLWTVNTETGRADIIREYHAQYFDLELVGLAYDCKNRTLWATGYRRGFYSIDPANATLEEFPVSAPGELFENNGMHGLAYNYLQDALVAFRFYWMRPGSGAGILFRLNWREGAGKDILTEVEAPPRAHGLAYDPDMNVYWAVNEDGDLFSMDPAAGFKKTLHRTGLGQLDGLVYAHHHACSQRPFQINYGLTDAWYDSEIPGQGFFVNVFPESGTMFIGWFTFDLDGFTASSPIVIGAGEHRWLTAQGWYENDAADLELYLTRGGLFDSTPPGPVTSPYGHMYLRFDDCDTALMQYSIPGAGIEGEKKLSRVSDQRVALCREIEFQTPLKSSTMQTGNPCESPRQPLLCGTFRAQ